MAVTVSARTLRKDFLFIIILLKAHAFFFHPDCTVGMGVAPNQPLYAGRRLYCQSRIADKYYIHARSLCPEGWRYFSNFQIVLFLHYICPSHIKYHFNACKSTLYLYCQYRFTHTLYIYSVRSFFFRLRLYLSINI